MKPITVLLVDDHDMVREGFRLLLEQEPDIKVIGEAATGRQAIRLSRKLNPEVVVMDIAMPLLNGLDATRQIHQALPGIKVLILSGHDDDAYVDQLTEFGASGLVLKQSASHMLVTAIREVHKGKTFFSPLVAKRMERRHQAAIGLDGRHRKQRNRLSPREVEVLQLVAEGQLNKQIAEELGISFKTVDRHRQNLMMKLNIHDAAGLTRYAISAGIIENKVQLTIV